MRLVVPLLQEIGSLEKIKNVIDYMFLRHKIVWVMKKNLSTKDRQGFKLGDKIYFSSLIVLFDDEIFCHQ